MDGMLLVDFRRRATSALMHPVTLAALGVLLVNDLLFKALWPGAWIPGKLSDLAWMVFAPPLLAYILSFATPGNGRGQRAAFAATLVCRCSTLPSTRLHLSTTSFCAASGSLAVTDLVRPWTRRTRSSSPLRWPPPSGYGAGRPWSPRAYALALHFSRRPPPPWQAWPLAMILSGALGRWAGLPPGHWALIRTGRGATRAWTAGSRG